MTHLPLAPQHAHCHCSDPTSCVSSSKVSSQGRRLKSSVLTRVARGPRCERHPCCHGHPGVSAPPPAGVTTSSALLSRLPVGASGHHLVQPNQLLSPVRSRSGDRSEQSLILKSGPLSSEPQPPAAGCFVMNVVSQAGPTGVINTRPQSSEPGRNWTLM